MNIKNIFKKQPKQQQYVDIKYSKLDHIGKVQRIPIVQKEQLDNINNQIANFQTKLNELETSNNLLLDKINKFNMVRGFCNDSYDFTKLLKVRLTNDYVVLDWKTLSDSVTFEVNDYDFNRYLKKGCKYIQSVYLSTIYWGSNHWNYSDYTSPILLNQKTFYVFSNDTVPEKLTFSFNPNQTNEPKPPLSSFFWQNNLVNLTYQQGYAPDITQRIFFKVIIELIRIPINNNYLKEEGEINEH